MRRVDPGLGLLCELPAGEAGQAGGGLPLTPGYAHISNLSDEQVEDLAKVGVGGGTAGTGWQRVVLLLVWLVQLVLVPGLAPEQAPVLLPPRLQNTPCTCLPTHLAAELPDGAACACTGAGIPTHGRPGGAVPEALGGGAAHPQHRRWVAAFGRVVWLCWLAGQEGGGGDTQA